LPLGLPSPFAVADLPSIRAEDLEANPADMRAQKIGRDGSLIFKFGSSHVSIRRNAGFF
jgi:hypothetical protein